MEYHARDASEPTLDEVIDAAMAAAGTGMVDGGLGSVVSTAVRARVVEALLRLAAAPETSFVVRSQVEAKLNALADSQGDAIRRRVADFDREPERFKPEPVLAVPPGMPIGDDGDL